MDVDIPIRRFGQYVKIEVFDKKKDIIFSTDSLRVDFDIRNTFGWIRAKITIFNLEPTTIKNITSNGNLVTIKTALHDSKLTEVASKLYISNTMMEKQVPNGLLNLFCVSNTYTEHLAKQIDVKITQDITLPNIIKTCLEDAKFKGDFRFYHFPTEVKEYQPPKLESTQQGSLASVLETLSKQYHFNYYTVNDSIYFMYKPNKSNVHKTNLQEVKPIILDSNNMRNTPTIGLATLTATSNLDPSIYPTSVLDVSRLITVGAGEDQDTLAIATDIIKDSIAGYQYYQVLEVQHKGSNWTDVWLTQILAGNPYVGKVVNEHKWWL